MSLLPADSPAVNHPSFYSRLQAYVQTLLFLVERYTSALSPSTPSPVLAPPLTLSSMLSSLASKLVIGPRVSSSLLTTAMCLRSSRPSFRAALSSLCSLDYSYASTGSLLASGSLPTALAHPIPSTHRPSSTHASSRFDSSAILVSPTIMTPGSIVYVGIGCIGSVICIHNASLSSAPLTHQRRYRLHRLRHMHSQCIAFIGTL